VRCSIGDVSLEVGAARAESFATILIYYLVKTGIVGWRTKYRFDGLSRQAV
jgi:hypothetical protein